MATQALYNKWRGQSFADVLGQEHITTTLQNQIKAGRIGHAYLFTGLRGTGKTSTARIMAKAVNCVGQTELPPCNQCPICRSISEGRSLDLIEIDAASNRGIDEIRELRDKVNFAPSECRFKVYVVDEVHMLTNEAFNALLKTLEEPPAHVIFILCTTEPHRLPETVLSRCQRFDFRRGALSALLQKLRRICDEEHIAITPEALEFIARRATGSFRDAESLLDQLAAYGTSTINLELVQSVLGSVPAALIAQWVVHLVNGDVPAGLRLINAALDNGAEPRQFLSEILDHLRALMLLKVGSDEDLNLGDETLAELRQVAHSAACSLELLVRAIKLFNEAGNGLRTAARPQLPLELAFIEATLPTAREASSASLRLASPSAEAPSPEAGQSMAPASTSTAVAPQSPPSRTRAKASRAVAALSPAITPPEEALFVTVGVSDDAAPVDEGSSVAEPAVQEQEPTDAKAETVPTLTLEWVRSNWRQAVLKIRPQSPQVQALLNSAEAIEVHENQITLGCVNSLVCEKLGEEKRRDLVERVLSQVLGVPCHIKCVIQAPRPPTHSEPPHATPPPAGASSSPAPDLFSAEEEREKLRQKLREHPAVKELEKRGGRVTRVSIREEEEQEGNRG